MTQKDMMLAAGNSPVICYFGDARPGDLTKFYPQGILGGWIDYPFLIAALNDAPPCTLLFRDDRKRD